MSDEHKEISLDDLSSGEAGVISGVDCPDRELRQKLFTMGLVVGTPLAITGVAPFGCPISVKLLGTTVALRRAEAHHIRVTI